MSVYSELEKLRDYFNSLPIEARRASIKKYGSRQVKIDSDLYTQSAWLDWVDEQQILVVQAQKVGFFSDNNYCLGTKFLLNGSTEHISNEQLWDMGIP